MHDEMPFGLARQTKYAALSSEDLNNMGKRAANDYLSCGVPLNQAVVKMAQQHPSISPHQVMRVVEYANQETFQRLFDDNEKYASDKNIDFPLADPRTILHELNDGARPHIMTPPPDDYSQAPVKMAHADVEADLELCRTFGMKPTSPGIEKEASARVETGPVDRILDACSEKEASWAGVGQSLMTAGRRIGAGKFAPAMKSLRTAGKRFTGSAGSGLVAGAGIGAATGAAAAGPDNRMRGALTGGLLGAAGGAMAGTGAKGMRQLWSGAAKGAKPVPFAAMKPGWRSAAGAGAAGLGGGVLMQKSSSDLTKQAMNYAKSGRSKAYLVLDDLLAATSVERIKQATADRGYYPDANPYGDLIRTRQLLTKTAQDARDSAAKNESLYHEALSKLAFEVKQHLLRGGNLGSVAHAMESVTPPDAVKIAMRAIIPDLQKHGLDPVKAQAEVVHYEMVKGASARVLNPNHPIVQAYASMVKLAEGQATLEQGYNRLCGALSEVEGTLKEAMVRHAATR